MLSWHNCPLDTSGANNFYSCSLWDVQGQTSYLAAESTRSSPGQSLTIYMAFHPKLQKKATEYLVIFTWSLLFWFCKYCILTIPKNQNILVQSTCVKTFSERDKDIVAHKWVFLTGYFQGGDGKDWQEDGGGKADVLEMFADEEHRIHLKGEHYLLKLSFVLVIFNVRT